MGVVGSQCIRVVLKHLEEDDKGRPKLLSPEQVYMEQMGVSVSVPGQYTARDLAMQPTCTDDKSKKLILPFAIYFQKQKN